MSWGGSGCSARCAALIGSLADIRGAVLESNAPPWVHAGSFSRLTATTFIVAVDGLGGVRGIVRATEDSLMNQNIPVLGSVNRRWAGRILGLWEAIPAHRPACPACMSGQEHALGATGSGSDSKKTTKVGP